MIGKEEFTELINNYIEQDKRINKLCEIFENAFESSIINYGYELFNKLLKIYFTEDGSDWIFYYLHENLENCYYENGKRIQLETIDDLWELIKEYRI